MNIYILGLLTMFIMLSFVLATMSIKAQYTGALACWTICATPLVTILGVVLNSSVKKSTAENTSGNGDGIRYSHIMHELENLAKGDEPTI